MQKMRKCENKWLATGNIRGARIKKALSTLGNIADMCLLLADSRSFLRKIFANSRTDSRVFSAVKKIWKWKINGLEKAK